MPEQIGGHSAEDILKCTFINEETSILIETLLKFVPMDPIENKLTLIQVMAWHQT